jgi:eukaryotic-like serine/threonine-protein kinase
MPNKATGHEISKESLPADALEGAPGSEPAPEREGPPRIPEHQLLRCIGGGSSGQVWLARNSLGTYRAVKVVPIRDSRPGQPLPHEFSGVVKFEPVSRLHDGLMDILQVGVTPTGEYFYCVMELADDANSGQTIVPEQYVPRTLAYDLAQRHRLPIGECVRNGAAIASALGFLHRHGLIHRDIKPSNIIFVNGFPKLADIGLVAAISEPRSYIGTDGFIPPEGAGTPQADIYSLGKVLYQMSTGKDRLEYPALPADLGDNAEDQELLRFNKIVLHACRTRPVRRFRSADELLTALLSFQFWTSELHRQETGRFWARVVGYAGLLVGLGFLSFCIWYLVHLLNQGQ